MKLCIHRGTKEIGGTCVEIESQGQRIVLDVGLPLDVANPDQFPMHKIKGFGRPDPSLLGVVISHPHQDHYGLAYRLPKDTLFLIGKAAKGILEAAEVFSPAGLRLENARHLEDRRPIRLGPFTITPFLVDHSAYDAYAVQVEADGVSLFYSGDLRAHGRKGKLFQKLLREPPQHVDVLLMEGTTIGRPMTAKGFPTEDDLREQFVKLFKATKGMPLVWCSGQNIDRIVTALTACNKAGRQFIIDMYTAHVLRATGNWNIPQADWDGIKVFLPESQKKQIKWKKRYDVSNLYKPYRIYPKQLAAAAPHSVMLFRPSMVDDVEAANCIAGSRLIYSMWSGYLENNPIHDWLRQHNIPLEVCHTSGHAAVDDLLKLRKRFKMVPVVPVHTEQPEQFDELFGNVKMREDGEWWEVGNGSQSSLTSEPSS